MSRSVTIQMPGCTSNCGPGFDTLGIALTLHNFVELTLTSDTTYIGGEDYGKGTQDMVDEVANLFFHKAGIEPRGFKYDIWGEVPRARGLSSSATVRCGIVAALNSLLGVNMSQEDMIALVSGLERAPDGVVACFKGGFCVSRIDPEAGTYSGSMRFEVPKSIAMVVVSPDTEVSTVVQREALPDTIPFQDVVKSTNSLSWIVAAFASGQYELLKNAVTDYIHEPYRERLCPFTKEAIRAGMEKGAFCGWLSGSGSSVLCVCLQDDAIEVGKAMFKTFHSNGIQARLLKLRTANTGLKILES